MLQQNELQDWRKRAIIDILESSNTLEKVMKFEMYRGVLGDCKIFLFDEETSNIDDSFKDYEIGKCGIYGLGDYTKTWIIDSRYSIDTRYIPFGKTLDFDLNIYTYLNKIMTGQNFNQGIDRLDIINYFNYVKANDFQIGIATALMERVTKPINSKILLEMLSSYVRYEKTICINEKYKKVRLNIFDYIRVLKLYKNVNKQIKEGNQQFDIICCCVMKAYLIKKYDMEMDSNKKVEKFINYCLRVLNCYLEKEIVLLALYIMDDDRTRETFKKLNKKSKIEEHILNVSWDIYHIRLIEQIMLYDNVGEKEGIILSYFATADKGLIDAMKINPLKAYVILNNYPIAFHCVRLGDICANEDILEESITMATIRKENVKITNYALIKKQLQEEIRNLQI